MIHSLKSLGSNLGGGGAKYLNGGHQLPQNNNCLTHSNTPTTLFPPHSLKYLSEEKLKFCSTLKSGYYGQFGLWER